MNQDQQTLLDFFKPQLPKIIEYIKQQIIEEVEDNDYSDDIELSVSGHHNSREIECSLDTTGVINKIENTEIDIDEMIKDILEL